MGKDKTTVVSQGSTQATPTAEETELNKLMLDREKAVQPGMIQAQQSGLNLVNALLIGGELPNAMQGLWGGISSDAVSTQAGVLARQNMPGYQQGGILDSGVAMRDITKRIANELLYPTEQFNIGAKQNLLNLALSGQAQVQSPILQGQSTLSGALAGLRQVNTSQSQTTQSMNPFLKSFQQSMGQTLGSEKLWLGK